MVQRHGGMGGHAATAAAMGFAPAAPAHDDFTRTYVALHQALATLIHEKLTHLGGGAPMDDAQHMEVLEQLNRSLAVVHGAEARAMRM